jgi:tRNA dimethylallyltransferase
LPAADAALRAAIDDEAAAAGWPALHRQLAEVDPQSAARINANDSQRIQRALEVYRLSGRTLSSWHADDSARRRQQEFLKLALLVDPRAVLHERIAARWQAMLADGFIEEVRALKARPGLTAAHPSMRAVGYRQIWSYLDGRESREDASAKALAATRQLAKRQITWLRSEKNVLSVNPLDSGALATITTELRGHLII